MNWDPIWDALAAWSNNLLINTTHGVATTLWYVVKLFAGITEWFTNENSWTTMMEMLMSALRNLMPQLMETLTFGDSSSPGLMYIALMFAGFLMIVPQLQHQSPLVDTGRVIVHGLLLVTLFTSSTAGFDLIALVESMRQWTTQTVIDNVSETGSLNDLVAIPMRAEPDELADWTFILPDAFEEHYYPQPDLSDIETRTVTILDSALGQIEFEIDVETAVSQQARRSSASDGLLMSTLTLAPATILFLFGITFATLAAAALVLVVFFLVALPLGFFEFGAEILSKIVHQYTYIVALTLVGTIFPGLLLGVGALVFDGNPTIGDMVGYFPILVIVGIATQYIMQMAFKGMTGSFGMVTATMAGAVGAMAYNATIPNAGHAPGSPMISGASKMAVAAAGGVISGGVEAMMTAAILDRKNSGSENQQHVFQPEISPMESLVNAEPGTPPLDLDELPTLLKQQEKYEQNQLHTEGKENNA